MTLKKRLSRKNKTLKNKIDNNLYYSDFKTNYLQTRKMSNTKIIEMLESMQNLMSSEKNPRARVYSKAKETIMMHNKTIKNTTDLKSIIGKPGISKDSSITKTIVEFLKTGKVELLEKAKNDPKQLFMKIYGVGPKMAAKLAKEHNLTSIDELREKQDELLNDVQKKGLKYYEDILERIPRKEIDKYDKVLQKYFKDVKKAMKNKDATMEIVGSWRRGAKTSGDIDIIICDPSNDNAVFKNYIDKLIEKNIMIEVLSRGKVKTLGISRITKKHLFRRIDFMFTPKTEFAFAILYFTGSKIFNTLMRSRAVEMGYTMNEHGIYHFENKKKGKRINKEFLTEKSIFEFLGIEWREPTKRIDGNSFKLVEENTKIEPKNSTDKSTEKSTYKSNEKSTEKTALKKKHQDKNQIKKNILKFKSQGETFLKTLKEKNIEEMIKLLDDFYYGKNKPLVSDEEYDVLREWAEETFPENKVIKQGHEGIVVDKKKVKLPYFLGSMDKIKPDTNVLKNWINKFKGPYVISAKLDGMSALYCNDNGESKLYTRGKGNEGFDISHLIPFVKLPNTKDIVVRGELIIKKENFKKYQKEYSNERSFAAGMVNGKKLEKSKLQDLDFVAYEVIKPDLKPSLQYKLLKNKKFITVINKPLKTIDQNVLSDYLVKWRESYDYIIDGVICIDNKKYKRKTKGNPDHAFAFKKVMNDQIVESKVIDVLWSKTKYGYVKPKIKMQPVIIGGVKITYATAHNAKYIVDNKIGIGSVIQVVRSGDVIPKVLKVVKSSKEPKMPDMAVKWNKTKVDLILEDAANDLTVRDKTTLAFFKTINVDGLKEGNIKKIIAGGYDTIGKILNITIENLLEIPGFKEKMAKKIYESIELKVKEAQLPLLMDASNMFGHGMGENRMKLIMEAHPDILESKLSSAEKRDLVMNVDGFAEKTAIKFVKNIPKFKKFMKENKLDITYVPAKKTFDKSHPLYEKRILMSGFRDEDLKNKIRKFGAQIANSVSNHLDILIIKDENTTGSKKDKAEKIGTIQIMTKDEFIKKY